MEQKGERGSPFKGAFLAPEHFFTARSQTNERRPISDHNRMSPERHALRMSARYPGLVLLPGSVSYPKPIVRPGGARAQLKFDPATGHRTAPETTAPNRRPRAVDKRQSYLAQAPAVRDAQDFDVREWGAPGYDAGGNAVPSLRDISASVQHPLRG